MYHIAYATSHSKSQHVWISTGKNRSWSFLCQHPEPLKRNLPHHPKTSATRLKIATAPWDPEVYREPFPEIIWFQWELRLVSPVWSSQSGKSQWDVDNQMTRKTIQHNPASKPEHYPFLCCLNLEKGHLDIPQDLEGRNRCLMVRHTPIASPSSRRRSWSSKR